MDGPIIMGILQGFSKLLDILHHSSEGKSRPFGMGLAQGALRDIRHDDKGHITYEVNTKVIDWDNIWMA